MILKILYVIDGIEFGGGERGFLQLIQGLDQNKYQIRVACTPGGEFGRRLRGMGVSLEPVNMKRRFNPSAILELARIIRRGNFDIVHSQGARADFFTRLAIRLTHHPRLVSTVQMPVEGYNVGRWRKSVYIFLDRLTERFVDRFIVVSDALKETLLEGHKIPPRKVVRIYNGIEIEQYQPDAPSTDLRKEWGVPSNAPLIGAIGRLVWQKGLTYLIQAMPSILQASPETRLVLVGEGPLEKELSDEVRNLGINGSALFAGFRNDIPSVLAALDLLVVPSVQEGFPMTILEAMAMAKPIVATDIRGIREQIQNGKTGILVSAGDPQALAEAIILLLKDRFKARELGMAARKQAEEMFDLKRQLILYEEVYKELVKEKRVKV